MVSEPKIVDRPHNPVVTMTPGQQVVGYSAVTQFDMPLANVTRSTMPAAIIKDAIVAELCRQSLTAEHLYVGERTIGTPDELFIDGEINLDALAGAILKLMEHRHG